MRNIHTPSLRDEAVRSLPRDDTRYVLSIASHINHAGQPADSGLSPPGDIDRLAALYSLDLIQGRPSERFDRISRLASRALGAPIALITLLDDEEQFFCSAVGTEKTGTSRADSFCTHAVTGADPVMVVADTHDDDRFIGNPLVTDDPYVRFYAGAPISVAGHRVGTLCVLDIEPRTITADHLETLRDLADIVEQELRHTSEALTDDLTGLANRRAFEAAADRFVALGQRRSEPVSVVYADVNGLKHVNDTSGHVYGDALLRRAAHVLTTSTRRADIVARLSGDEFAVLLYGSGPAEAAAIIDKIEQTIAISNELEPGDTPMSIAFGVATLRDGDDVASLVERADAAMYESKRRRRLRRSTR